MLEAIEMTLRIGEAPGQAGYPVFAFLILFLLGSLPSEPIPVGSVKRTNPFTPARIGAFHAPDERADRALPLANHFSRADERGLKVSTQVRPGVNYVGQAIDLLVSAVAGRERPEVTVPPIPGAELDFVGNDPLRPMSASGIGDLVFETNLFRSRYRVIARRAGVLTIPQVSARIGERSVSSVPLSLNVKSPPESGRTADFLGGVGAFEVEAGAEPAAVRTGQVLEYRVTVKGPGARGITAAPSLARLSRLQLGIQLERRPDQAVADPPSHTFVYRLRPTLAGSATLPPVAVAAFDPKSGHYVTKVTPGIPVRVADAPGFDPESIGYRPPPPQRTADRVRAIGGWIAGLMSCLSALAVTVIVRRLRRKPVSKIRRLLREARSRLERVESDADAAQAIADALTGYLGLAIGRPPGVLTPVEARQGVVSACGSDGLGVRAFGLLTVCDRARFDPRPVPTGPLWSEGERFLRDLGAAPLVGGALGKSAGGESR